MSGTMASNIQWNAVRKEIEAKRAKISHRRLKKNIVSLALGKMEHQEKRLNYQDLPRKVCHKIINNYLLGLFDWLQIRHIQLFLLHSVSV